MAEQDRDDPEVYYLRSKKRRTDHGEVATCSYVAQNTYKRKSPIMHMPLEVIQNVLKFLTFQELSQNIRKINGRFKLAAEDLLNRTFKGLSSTLKQFSASTLKAMHEARDDMEVKCFCRLLNLVEIIHFQHSVIMATIWRYVYNEVYKSQRSCMYGGHILDLYEVFLENCSSKPYQIYGPAVIKDYAYPEVVKKIVRFSKYFCIHFDKVVEEKATNTLRISACKIIDLLDNSPCALRTVVYERISGNMLSAKYVYYLRNAWFVALDIPAEKEMTMPEKQRMMHMRIRRIIWAHSEMFMQQNQSDRELQVRPNAVLKKPSVSVYTGYGEVHNIFYCYGAMNDVAYLQKFNLLEENNDEDVEAELQVGRVDANNEDVNDLDAFYFIPHLGLDIDITIDCPLAFAPHKYVKEHIQSIKETEASTWGMFDMKVNFHCSGAYYPRLPQSHSYYKKVSTRY